MSRRFHNQRRILRDLEEYGRNGRYRDAFRAYLRAQSFKPSFARSASTTDSLIQLQFAIALQHAGLFEIALNTYRHVASELLQQKNVLQSEEITVADIIYNAKVQQAVLLERLAQPREALMVLREIGSPETRQDANLAMASLESWIDITKLKCALVFRKGKSLKALARRRSKTGDWNQKLWGRLFVALSPLVDGTIRSRMQLDSIVKEVQEVESEMDKLDPGASPWITLIGGQEIARRSPTRAAHLLSSSHQKATAFGKFFVIAASCEDLSACYRRLRRQDESRRMLRRALSAYARCGLLMLEPFTRRLFLAASKLWQESTAADILVRSAHLLVPREDLIFSQMCALNARRQHLRPDEVFENFVRDWAGGRYVGRYVHVERGRESVDALIVQDGKAIAIQAKHVAVPKSHIPKRLHLRKLAEVYNVEVERYVFVLTTSADKGWRENLWHAQYTERVRQLIPHTSIRVEVVLEPELQTDVVLDDDLFEKYFKVIHGSTRLHRGHRHFGP